MIAIAILFFTAAFTLTASGREISRDAMLNEAEFKVIEALCTSERFTECSGDATELCRSQMKFIIIPHCKKTRLKDLPQTLDNAQAQAAANLMAKCAAMAYPVFNQLDLDEFRRCMSH